MKRKFSSVLLVLMAVLMVFTGCNPAPSNNGSVKIYLSDASSKAINPDGADSWAGLGVDSYELVISSGESTVYSKSYDVLPSEAVELSLPVGKYDFAANAKSGENIVAKAEQKDVIVSSRNNAQVSLVIDAFGTGNVEVGFAYAEGSVANGAVTATLTNLATKAVIEMAVSEDKIVAEDVAVGSYILEMVAPVKLEATELTGEAEGIFIKSDIVYVENGKTSSANWTVKYEGNKASISIDSNVGEPVSFDIQVTSDNAEFDEESGTYYIPVDSDVTLKAVGDNIEDYSFEWSFDGAASNGTEVTISYDSYDLGKLSLLVTAKEGSTYGYGYKAWTVESTDFVNGIYYVGSVARLEKFSEEVNAGNPLFVRGNIVLDADIDLENEPWEPIGTPSSKFLGSFDGQEYTVSNLVSEEGAEYAGLFGYADNATIKNLKIENVRLEDVYRAGALVASFKGGNIENVSVENVVISASRQSGGIAGSFYGQIKNSSVKDVDIVLTPNAISGGFDNGDKAGGIAGLSQTDNNSGLIENCTVENVSIKAYRDAGVIIGAADGYILVGNTVKGTNSIEIDQVTNHYGNEAANAGMYLGRNFDNSDISPTNTIEEDASYSVSIKLKNNDAVGDILKTDAKDISVVLSEDLKVDVDAWAAEAWGSDNTDTIVIDAAGKTIDFNQKNSDWNNIGTLGAKLIIKNAHLTNSGYNNGPWNRHDLNFACDVELYNVTSDKAMAFKAGAVLEDVVINDPNTSDTYAIWIQPNGQTVSLNNCVIDMLDCTDGRGIKIDNQYVAAENEKIVTLSISNTTFKTEEKPAVLVKTTVGAVINWGEGNDISGVAADSVNAVWVDEDAADTNDLVIVTGCTKKIEGQNFGMNSEGQYVADSNDANPIGAIFDYAKSLEEVKIEIAVPEGEINLPSNALSSENNHHEVVITGAGVDETTINGAANPYGDAGKPGNYAHGQDLYFKDLTFETVANGYQGGFGHAKSVTFENCKIVGQFYCHSKAPHKFINCEIDPLDGYLYTYASDCEFINCTFTASKGKALQVYGEADVKCEVLIKDCEFTAAMQATTWDGKPVTPIDINTANGYKVDVTIENCTTEGFPKGLNSNSDLWNVKNTTPGLFTVTVDGELVYPFYSVDDDGNYTVRTSDALRYAIDEIESDRTITLKDGTYEGLFFAQGKSMTIEAENKGEAIINGKLAIAASGKTVNVKDIVFSNDYDEELKTNNQYVDKTGKYCIGLYCGSVNVEGCAFNLSDNGAINFYAMNKPEYSTIKDCTFNCNGNRPILSKAYLTVDNCTFNDQYKYSVQVYGNQTPDGIVKFINNKIIDPGKTSGKTDVSLISISKSYEFEGVEFTSSGNIGLDRYVYDNDAKIKIDTCTINGSAANTVFEIAE